MDFPKTSVSHKFWVLVLKHFIYFSGRENTFIFHMAQICTSLRNKEWARISAKVSLRRNYLFMILILTHRLSTWSMTSLFLEVSKKLWFICSSGIFLFFPWQIKSPMLRSLMQQGNPNIALFSSHYCLDQHTFSSETFQKAKHEISFYYF